VPRSAIGDGSVIVGVRPESWTLVGSWRKDSYTVDTDLLEELGAESFVYASGTSGKVVVRVDRTRTVAAGERVHLQPKPGEVYFFSAATGNRLR